MDPWQEIAEQLAAAINNLEGAGVSLVGEQTVETWPEFMDLYTDTSVNPPIVQGWQVSEPTGGGYQSTGDDLAGGFLTDVLSFHIRGFREMGGDPGASQVEFRDVAWRVRRLLDSLQSFTLTDDTVELAWSYPSSVSQVQPMAFGEEIDAWGCDITKQVNVHRRNEAPS